MVFIIFYSQGMVKLLADAGIPAILVPDAAVGFIMEKVDLVMVGAEAVVESGGIINTMGTFGIAVLAKAANKPFYVGKTSSVRLITHTRAPG